MKKIRQAPGRSCPRPTPRLLSPAVVFIPLRDHERRHPEPHEHDGAHVGAVARQVRPAERGGQRRGAEREQRRVERDAVHEDEPGRLEAGPVTERLADPDEDAALVAGRELGRDQADGQQEEQRGDQVDGDRAEAEGRRVRELGDAARRWRPSSSPGPATRSVPTERPASPDRRAAPWLPVLAIVARLRRWRGGCRALSPWSRWRRSRPPGRRRSTARPGSRSARPAARR